MSMNTITEGGADIRVLHLPAKKDEFGKHDAKVCISIGSACSGDFGLHVYPVEAIRIADCLIQMAKEAQRTEMLFEEAASTAEVTV